MSPSTRYILSKLEKYPLFETSEEEHDSMKESFEKHCEDMQWANHGLSFLQYIFPIKFLFVVFISLGTIAEYYSTHCQYDGERGWIPRPLHMPDSPTLSFPSFLFPYLYPVSVQADASWTMPTMVEAASANLTV